MNANWSYLVAYTLVLLSVGYFLPFIKDRRLARISGWSIAVISLLVSTSIASDQVPLVRMAVFVFLQLLSMKILVAIETYSKRNGLRFFQWVAFTMGWFGMRASLFERLPSPSKPFVEFTKKGVLRIVIGICLLLVSRITEQYSGRSDFFLSHLVLLAGLSMILHFGLLNLSAGLWRSLGVDVSELFRSPYRSTSLSEFWGRRWNVAFSEMTALVAYRPLKSSVGIDKAVVISFLLSGILHEIAISFPVRSGYGLPMLYFMIHAAALQLEGKSSFVEKILRHKILSRMWVMALLILPLPLLFHGHFVSEVLIPMRDHLLEWIVPW